MSENTNMASATSGVKPMNIVGRVVSERERLHGMTDEERAWRKQWLKDQFLSPKEPIKMSKEVAKEFLNPIRRFYRAPLDALFFKLLEPRIGHHNAAVFRFYTGRSLMGLWIIMGGFYYFKYNQNDWTRKGSWRVIQSRVAVYPGEPGFPALTQKTQPDDYANRGFKETTFYKKAVAEGRGLKDKKE